MELYVGRRRSGFGYFAFWVLLAELVVIILTHWLGPISPGRPLSASTLVGMIIATFGGVVLWVVYEPGKKLKGDQLILGALAMAGFSIYLCAFGAEVFNAFYKTDEPNFFTVSAMGLVWLAFMVSVFASIITRKIEVFYVKKASGGGLRFLFTFSAVLITSLYPVMKGQVLLVLVLVQFLGAGALFTTRRPPESKTAKKKGAKK